VTSTITEPTLFDVADRTGLPYAPEATLLLKPTACETDWHVARATGIGGSDVAAILGLDKYKSPRHVYEAKHGRKDKGDSEAAEFGREVEDVIARVWSRRTGLALAPSPGTLQNIERPWMIGNPDRLVLDEVDQVAGPLECKNRSEWQLSDWEEDEAPDAPALQTIWYMAVAGWQTGYVAACVGGNKLRWHRIERDEALIGHLIEYCGDWWERHIVDGEPPPPDGHPATKDLLAHLWDAKPEAVAEVDVDKARDLLKRRAALKAAIKRAEDKLELIDNTMRLAAGENEIVKTPGNKVAWTWKQNGNFDPKGFAAEFPALAEQYTKTVTVIDTKALKAAHETEYRKHQGRRLYVPKKGV
jgi:putative phage-type endonuclease